MRNIISHSLVSWEQWAWPLVSVRESKNWAGSGWNLQLWQHWIILQGCSVSRPSHFQCSYLKKRKKQFWQNCIHYKKCLKNSLGALNQHKWRQQQPQRSLWGRVWALAPSCGQHCKVYFDSHARTRCEGVDRFRYNAVLLCFKPLHSLSLFWLGLKLVAAPLRLLLFLVRLKKSRKKAKHSQF